MRLIDHIPAPILSRFRNYRELQLMRRYKSKMTTPVYHDYLRRSQSAAGNLAIEWPEAEPHAARFQRDGFTSFWTPELETIARSVYEEVRREEESGRVVWDELGRYPAFYTRFPQLHALFAGPLGDFVKAVNRSHFKIYYGVLFKSEHQPGGPIGSQLWHWDGGPGTCMNVMFYLRDVEPKDGAMECLPWKYTYRILRKDRLTREVDRRIDAVTRGGRELTADERRTIRCEWFREQIEAEYQQHVQQPFGRAGLVLPFRNNLLHRGGYPQEPGRTRYVCVFHVYPSHKPAPLERYAAQGLEKRGSHPADPAEDF